MAQAFISGDLLCERLVMPDPAQCILVPIETDCPGAMLDRLTHKVHIIEANGQSYRLEQSRKRLARQKKLGR